MQKVVKNSPAGDSFNDMMGGSPAKMTGMGKVAGLGTVATSGGGGSKMSVGRKDRTIKSFQTEKRSDG